MFRSKIYVFTIFIVFLFTINSFLSSCKDQGNTAPEVDHAVDSSAISTFDRESELIEVLNQYEIPTNNTTIVLMPPTKCSSCKLGALAVVDTMKNIYILTGDTSFYKPLNKSQKLICYDSELINKKGLVKLYTAIISINQNRVVRYQALTN